MTRIPINIAKGTIEEVKQEKLRIVGIDLGTTNSLIAIIEDGQAKILKEDSKSGLVPSIVYFGDDGSIKVGDEARAMQLQQPERTIYSAKRLLGKSLEDLANYQSGIAYTIVGDQENTEGLLKVRVGDTFYNAVQLSAEILKSLKTKAETILNESIQKAVITVPAYFNDAQRQATRDAGKLAGLDVLRIINEPTAASLAYGAGVLLDGSSHHVAVYDLGGGTFDVSILYIDNGIFEVLSTHGDTSLGGDDMDAAIVEYWMSKYSLSENDRAQLKMEAEKAKKHLSVNPQYTNMWKAIELVIDLETFHTLIQPMVNQTLDSCKQAMHDSGLQLTQIDKVILVGGSTRVPLVEQRVSSFFGKKAQSEINPDEVVALGAAIQADILAGNRKDILLLDITPLSLGIETVGGLMDVIIARNSKVPSGAGRQYTTSVDGQKNLRVSIFQGERDLVQYNRKLGELVLGNIPPMPAGIPKIEVKFVLDADGILTVSAEELRSNTKTSIQVHSQYGISEEEMGQMLIDSLQNAQQDMETRSLVEAQTEARLIVNATDKFIKQNKDWLAEQEVEQLNELNSALRASLESEKKDSIQVAMDNLNTYSRPLAEKGLDKAVESNLSGTSLNE